jgi:23S rRNA pseudouridine2605 synthase
MIDKTISGDAGRPNRRRPETPGEVREGQRIAKAMARAGLCSRRDAERWIAEGRVVVNGRTLDSPAFNVGPGDDVRVDGKPLAAPERTRLFLYNKPRGLVTTARDPEGRPTIFENLPQDLPRLVAVGRLDINTEGLILLTNDGGLARVLELPATGWLRRYRVRAHGEVAQAALDGLSEGVTIDGVDYAGIEALLDREQGSNVWMTMGLREGKNREIKKVLEHLGLAVNRLIRVSFGPFQLGELEEGAVVEVRTRVLRDQLGAKLAREAGADFDAPAAPHGEPDPKSAREPHVRPAREGERLRGARGFDRRPRPEGFEEREARAKSDPKTSYGPKTRKHVSTLRAEIREGAGGPRKRIERGAVADRKGREVKVERLLPTIEEARRRAVAAARAKERRAGAGEGRPGGRAPRPGDTARPARGGAPQGERRPRRESEPVHSARADAAPARAKPFRKGSHAGGKRGPSSEAKPFREGAPRPGPRARDEAKPSRKGPPGGPRPRDEARRDGGKPFRKGPPRDRSGGRPGGGSRPRRG